MRMVSIVLTVIALGGCLHIDVHKHEQSSTTTTTTEEHHVQDN